MADAPPPAATAQQQPPARGQRHRRRPRGVDSNESQELDTEEWRLTYMDTITLIVAMFVLLLTMANFDSAGVPAPAPTPTPPQEDQKPATGNVATLTLPPPGTTGQEPVAVLPSRILDLSSPRPTGSNLILTGPLPQGVTRTVDDTGVQLEISESVLFPSGSADLSTLGVATLDQLVPVLQEGPFPVSVEGHSDDRAIATGRFPSNWELSSARASVVVRHFISRGVVEGRLRAIGYAATRPVDRADTNEARARNRRVDLRLETKAPARP